MFLRNEFPRTFFCTRPPGLEYELPYRDPMPSSSHTLSPSASLVSTFSSSWHSLSRKKNLRDMVLGGHCSPGTGAPPA